MEKSLANSNRLDTRRYIDTPEGIAINISVAGPVTRSLAFVIDFFIRAVMYIILSLIFSTMGNFGMGLLLIAIFLIEWFYPVLFEVLSSGATPGKKSMGLEVIHDDGTPVGWNASMVRNLLRTVDFLPLFYGFGLISVLLSKDFKRMGDIVAGTLVVYKQNKIKTPVTSELEAVSTTYSLDPEEQQAILGFSERSHFMSEERINELATLTGPLVSDQNPSGNYLLGIAKWIAGRKS